MYEIIGVEATFYQTRGLTPEIKWRATLNDEKLSSRNLGDSDLNSWSGWYANAVSENGGFD